MHVLLSLLAADPTLTLRNIFQLLEGANWEYEGMPFHLDIPESEYKRIKRQHSDPALCKDFLCDYYLTNYITPSWLHVADALYRAEEHEVLAKDQVCNLKGMD